MKDLIVLVDNPKDWSPYHPSEDLMTASDFLFQYPKKERPEDQKTKVINLCKSYKYLSTGYYCSLLAESRDQIVIPSVKTMNDLSKKRLYLYDLDELQLQAQEAAKKYTHNDQGIMAIAFRCYFGKTKDPAFQDLGQQIYDQFTCPILEIKLIYKKLWKIDSVTPISFTDLGEGEEEFFGKALEEYSTKIWRKAETKNKFIFDLAILVNPEEAMPPSNEEALQLLEKCCLEKGIYTERITRKDLTRLNEFDGLFIRETTSIKNHTYAFSRRALQEDLVVIDDPNSILKCTNKIFMHSLMEKNEIPQLPSIFVSDTKPETLFQLEEEFGFPMVLKIPDGSFSTGVKKADDEEELKNLLNDYLKKSSMVLIQKFIPTDFDWRIGVLRGEALFGCKYFMSTGHWQIYNHQAESSDGAGNAGDSTTHPISEVPEHIVSLALKITSLIGDGLYGVDIKEYEGQAMVVEVNDNPNIDAGIEDEVLGIELYKKIAEAFLVK